MDTETETSIKNQILQLAKKESAIRSLMCKYLMFTNENVKSKEYFFKFLKNNFLNSRETINSLCSCGNIIKANTATTTWLH